MSLTAAARAMGRGALVTKARCMSVQYKAPVRDIKFVLDEVLDADRHYDKSGYEACDRDLRHSVIEECAKFAEDVLSPLNKVKTKRQGLLCVCVSVCVCVRACVCACVCVCVCVCV